MNYELNPTSESMKISQAVQQACSVGMKVFCWWVCKEELHLVKVHTGQKRCVIDLGSLPFLSGQDSPPREVTLWTSVFLFHWSLVGTQKIIFHILPDGMSSKPEIQGQWYSDGASAKGVEGGDNWENWNSHTRNSHWGQGQAWNQQLQRQPQLCFSLVVHPHLCMILGVQTSHLRDQRLRIRFNKTFLK